VFYRQAWYHSGACVTMSAIFSSIFALACIFFIYREITPKKSKKSNILSFNLLFASIKRGDSAQSNDTKSKFNDATFDFLDLFDYLHLRTHMGSGGGPT
jgi:hypothetical protein